MFEEPERPLYAFKKTNATLFDQKQFFNNFVIQNLGLDPDLYPDLAIA